MWELGMKRVAELADKAGVDYSTVRYFGMLSHDRGTIERLSMALDWPPGHLRKLWDGEQTSSDSTERP